MAKTKKPPKPGPSHDDLADMLKRHYKGDAWAFLPEVRNATGYSRRSTRYADAIVMGLWPSRGLDIHGFEIKANRADWFRELKRPDKAEEIAQYCDYWWLVVGDKSIVWEGELPRTWGLMAPKGRKLVVLTQPDRLEAKPPDRAFIASVLRTAESVIFDQTELEKARAAGHATGVDEGREKERQSLGYKVITERERAERAEGTLETFRKAAGITTVISDFTAKDIGKAVDVIRHGQTLEQFMNHMRQMLRVASKNQTNLQEGLQILEDYQKETDGAS